MHQTILNFVKKPPAALNIAHETHILLHFAFQPKYPLKRSKYKAVGAWNNDKKKKKKKERNREKTHVWNEFETQTLQAFFCQSLFSRFGETSERIAIATDQAWSVNEMGPKWFAVEVRSRFIDDESSLGRVNRATFRAKGVWQSVISRVGTPTQR